MIRGHSPKVQDHFKHFMDVPLMVRHRLFVRRLWPLLHRFWRCLVMSNVAINNCEIANCIRRKHLSLRPYKTLSDWKLKSLWPQFSSMGTTNHRFHRSHRQWQATFMAADIRTNQFFLHIKTIFFGHFTHETIKCCLNRIICTW